MIIQRKATYIIYHLGIDVCLIKLYKSKTKYFTIF